MPLETIQTTIPGVLVFQPKVFTDNRGFFLETYNQKNYAEVGLERTFVQDNHSRSGRNTLRGLHYQLNHPQGKLVYVVRGEIFDVAVDIRRGSPSFGHWFGVHLSEQNKKQIFVPEGFAHGFIVLSEAADVTYKCTDIFSPGDDYGILWSDETIGIQWPKGEKIILSEKDSQNPRLCQVPPDHLPLYQG